MYRVRFGPLVSIPYSHEAQRLSHKYVGIF